MRYTGRRHHERYNRCGCTSNRRLLAIEARLTIILLVFDVIDCVHWIAYFHESIKSHADRLSVADRCRSHVADHMILCCVDGQVS